jgi:microcystin degradation protein MlrC
MLRGEIHPTVAWQKIPMITPQDQFLTSEGPMKEWFDLARQMARSWWTRFWTRPVRRRR